MVLVDMGTSQYLIYPLNLTLRCSLTHADSADDTGRYRGSNEQNVHRHVLQHQPSFTHAGHYYAIESQFSSRHVFLSKSGGLDFGPRAYILATEPTLTYGSALAPRLGGFDHAGGSESERNEKPLPIGQRLPPNTYIESEIGQVDKRVLETVTRVDVERFIQDVIRKSIVEGLVFPNSHTLILGDEL